MKKSKILIILLLTILFVIIAGTYIGHVAGQSCSYHSNCVIANTSVKIDAKASKDQQAFYRSYKCEYGHISVPTGTNIDKYTNATTSKQTSLTTCPYAGCGKSLTAISKTDNNLVYISEQTMSSYFNNIYCVSYGQQLGVRNGEGTDYITPNRSCICFKM